LQASSLSKSIKRTSLAHVSREEESRVGGRIPGEEILHSPLPGKRKDQHQFAMGKIDQNNSIAGPASLLI
jgi:hypothetical protein